MEAKEAVVNLVEFVRESNRIERIKRNPTDAEILAHQLFLRQESLSLPMLQEFVHTVASARLRDQPGMDVVVTGAFRPMEGGYEVRRQLTNLLGAINSGVLSPYKAHVRYETLHPFTDGNGRSGRAIWMWQMERAGQEPFALPFLHRWYYESLDASR